MLQKETPRLGEKLEHEFQEKTRTFFKSVKRDNVEYKIGDCCYIDPSAFSFSVKHVETKKLKYEKREVCNLCVCVFMLIDFGGLGFILTSYIYIIYFICIFGTGSIDWTQN